MTPGKAGRMVRITPLDAGCDAPVEKRVNFGNDFNCDETGLRRGDEGLKQHSRSLFAQQDQRINTERAALTAVLKTAAGCYDGYFDQYSRPSFKRLKTNLSPSAPHSFWMGESFR